LHKYQSKTLIDFYTQNIDFFTKSPKIYIKSDIQNSLNKKPTLNIISSTNLKTLDLQEVCEDVSLKIINKQPLMSPEELKLMQFLNKSNKSMIIHNDNKNNKNNKNNIKSKHFSHQRNEFKGKKSAYSFHEENSKVNMVVLKNKKERDKSNKLRNEL